MFNWLFRRLGYVRLRDYNLRIGAYGLLFPIDRNEPTPIDLGSIYQLPSRRLEIRAGHHFEIAQGTNDGLVPVDPVQATPYQNPPNENTSLRGQPDSAPVGKPIVDPRNKRF